MAAKTILHSNTNTHGEYHGIDIIKFFCSYLICMVHIAPFVRGTPLFDNLNFYIQNGICRIAVPFYFATTAFLLFRKQDGNKPLEKGLLKKTCFKLFRLWGIWAFLLVFGGQIHLWYLGATALTVLLMNLFFKLIKSVRAIGIVCAFFYVIGLLGDSYRGFISPILDLVPFNLPSTRNAVCMGLMFAFIGVIISKYQIRIRLRTAVVGLMFSILLLYTEVFLLKMYSNPFDFNMCLSHIPTTFFLLYIAINIKNKNTSCCFRKLRAYGVLIYFTHLLISSLFDLVFSGIKTVASIDLMPIKIFLVFIVVTVLAIIIEKLSRKNHLSWLRYLYS